MFPAISYLFPEYDLGRVNTVRAGHFTSLTLVAESYPFIYRCFIVRAETLRIRAGLFGAGEIRIYP